MDAESKERGRDYLAADIFLTAARLAYVPNFEYPSGFETITLFHLSWKSPPGVRG